MKYRVTKKYTRGDEIFCAEFDDLIKAQGFVKESVEADVLLSVKVLYKIYDADKCLEEYDSTSTGSTQNQDQSSTKGNVAGLRPTPYNLAPRPSGMPHNWMKDNDEDEKKEK